MNTRSVYLDNNATTPVDPSVKKKMAETIDLYANPSSMHTMGREAREMIEEAREHIALLIGAEKDEIFFTAGGSESNNMVLKLPMHGKFSSFAEGTGKRRIITSTVEHPAVKETCEYLESEGVPVTWVGVDSEGKLCLDEFEKSLTDDSFLVSIMMGNNEIGTIQDIKSITEIAKKRGCLVHTDAVQALGKIDVDVKDLGVDYLSFSGHKFYGPKGVGGLFVRSGAPMVPLIHGGHQEEGLRAGTYNTAGIIGMGEAARIARDSLKMEYEHLFMLRNELKQRILENVPGSRINGHDTDTLPGTLNISFEGVEGESILLYLDLEGIAVSTGSACATGSLEPSHVLLAIGVDSGVAHGSIRFSFGKFNTMEDVDYVSEKLPEIIRKLRSMSTVGVGGVRV